MSCSSGTPIVIHSAVDGYRMLSDLPMCRVPLMPSLNPTAIEHPSFIDKGLINNQIKTINNDDHEAVVHRPHKLQDLHS